MKKYWDTQGDLPIEAVSTVWKQMAEAVAYIHSQCVVHRDVKPENFLIKDGQIDSPSVSIGLSDFDFAARVRPRQSLSSVCGSKHYMAPEMVKKNPKYGLPVDVWALGVILYGLISRGFLFSSRIEVQFKKISAPTRLPSEAQALFLGTLNRKDQCRVTATQILEHPWLSAPAADNLGALSEGCELPTILRSNSADIGSSSCHKIVRQLSSGDFSKINVVV
jgi:calcium-dependent protein kinase